MTDELDNPIEPTPASSLGVDSALSILVADSAILNIDPTADTIFTLADLVAERMAAPESDDHLKESLARIRDLLCSVLFDLEHLQLTAMAELPLNDLQAHLMTLSFDPPAEGPMEIGQPVVEPIPEEPIPESITEEPAAAPGEAPSAADIALVSDTAQEMWKAAHLFANETNPQLSSEHWMRLSNFHLALTVETESAIRMASGIQSFWPNRETLVRAILSTANGRVALDPKCADVIKHIETTRAEKLPDQRVPIGAVVAALRFILAKKDDTYHPSLLEAATLLLFLGRGDGNALGIQGLTQDECDDLIVTLFSLQKLKNDMVDCLSGVPMPHPQDTLSQVSDAIEKLNRLAAVEGG
ncbi:MAG: hypothetical protein HYZ71_03560 [Deltaproteobacteria bacterium]|nr:hypothetical protein [Deltaproteobacteria bacterium]